MRDDPIFIGKSIFIFWLIMLCVGSHRTALHLSRGVLRRMSPRYGTLVVDADSQGLSIASKALRDGELVAFPTETVYGLGAHALNDEAVKSIFVAKQRPQSDPIIVHVADDSSLNKLYDFEQKGSVNAMAVINVLAKSFWPGPLTIIFKANKVVPSSVTAGTGFVGVRCPRHPTAQALLRLSGVPVAAPSANRFGHVSPTSAAHVLSDLGDQPLLRVLLTDDASKTGGCEVGIESTVCRVSPGGAEVRVLRCGAVTSSRIDGALRSAGLACRVIVDNERNIEDVKQQQQLGQGPQRVEGTEASDEDNDFDIVAPGQMVKHYAPYIPTFVCILDNDLVEMENVGSDGNTPSEVSIGPVGVAEAMVIDFGGRLASLRLRACAYEDLSPSGDASEACVRVFALLREAEGGAMEARGVRAVLLPDLRQASQGDELLQALWERLRRAASGLFLRVR